MRKIIILYFIFGIVLASNGCVSLGVLAGAGGTALWQGGKIISEEQASTARAAEATKSAFKAKKIDLTSEVTREKVVQLRGEDQAKKKIAVDIFDKGPKNVRFEIRVGIGEEAPGRELLNEISRRM